MEAAGDVEVGAAVPVDAAARARSERNRLRARELLAARLAARPEHQSENESSGRCVIVGSTRLVDSGGGFLIEEPRDGGSGGGGVEVKVSAPPDAPPPLATEWPHCVECEARFPTSWLLEHFSYSACDACRERERVGEGEGEGEGGRHELVPRTQAKREYLLQDCDLDSRGGPLRALRRRNPHRAHGPDMRLYLRAQLEERALVVWGSRDRLEAERRTREDKREQQAHKKYRAELRALRMEARGTLYARTLAAPPHEHVWGEERADPSAEDVYSRRCTLCGDTQTYEKM